MPVCKCGESKLERFYKTNQSTCKACIQIRAKTKNAKAQVEVCCSNCGKVSTLKRTSGAERKYCSHLCQRRAASKRLSKKKTCASKEKENACQHCGTLYKRKDGFIKYCSKSCGAKAAKHKGNSRRRAAIKNVPLGRQCNINELIQRDGQDCQICHNPIDLSLRGYYGEMSPEVDHIIPLSRGGHDAEYNWQMVHRHCNNKKGNKVSHKDREKAKRLYPGWDFVVRLLSEMEEYKKTGPSYKNNKCGVKGVFFDKSKGKWTAKVERKGKVVRKDCFTFEEAVDCRKKLIEVMYAS